MEKYKILRVDEIDIENGFEVGQVVEGEFVTLLDVDKGYDVGIIAVHNSNRFALYKDQVEKI